MPLQYMITNTNQLNFSDKTFDNFEKLFTEIKELIWGHKIIYKVILFIFYNKYKAFFIYVYKMKIENLFYKLYNE